MKQCVLDQDTHIRYWQHHTAQRPTIVMIHGFTGSHEGFQYIVPLLDSFHIIIPDVPGFGVSTIGRDDWSIDRIAARLNQFVRLLRLPTPPHILGHSMGGLIVASMIAQAPELYHRRAILISPVSTPIRRNDRRRSGAILGALQYRIGHLIPQIGPRLVRSRLISRAATHLIMTTSDRKLRRAIHGHHLKNLDYISSIELYSRLHREINRHGAIEYADELRKFDVLLIVGDKDNVTPIKEQSRLATAIQPEQYEIICGVGHLVHYEAPKACAEAV